MVDVEQHALRALEEDALAVATRLVDVAPHRPRKGEDEVGDLRKVAFEAVSIDRRLAEPGAKRIMMRAKAIEQRIIRPA